MKIAKTYLKSDFEAESISYRNIKLNEMNTHGDTDFCF